MKIVSLLAIPLIIMTIIIYGLRKKIDIYDSFVKGAKEGLQTTLNIFPYLLTMIFAINLFFKSGVLEAILKSIPVLGDYSQLIAMSLMRPISGNGSMAILNEILSTSGPDSFVGRVASTIQGATDTTIYVLALYFGSVHIKKTKYALKVGLIADVIGIVASFIIVYFVFK